MAIFGDQGICDAIVKSYHRHVHKWTELLKIGSHECLKDYNAMRGVDLKDEVT